MQNKPNNAHVWNSKWVYIPACKTDILERFKAMNWVPPTQEKKACF